MSILDIEIPCRNCNKPFARNWGGNKYCCDECRDAFNVTNFARTKYIYCGNNAEVRGIKFDLSFQEFMQLWQEPCEYCGDKIGTIGIDRVDSRGGYNVDNIVPCCGTCNLMKNTYGQSFFISHCEKIVKFNLEKIQLNENKINQIRA